MEMSSEVVAEVMAGVGERSTIIVDHEGETALDAVVGEFDVDRTDTFQSGCSRPYHHELQP